MSECNFCYICGQLGDEAKNCSNTQCWRVGQRCNPGLDKYFARGPLSNREYIQKGAKSPTTDTKHHFYVCKECNYIMWHHLQYCPKCGGRFGEEVMTYKQMLEKYPSYLVGY